MRKLILSLTATFFIVSCAKSSGGGGDQDNSSSTNPTQTPKTHWINWDKIPSEYSPQITESSFNIDGFKKVNINIHGFDKDVNIIYSDSALSGELKILQYTVFKKIGVFGSLTEAPDGQALRLYTTTYSQPYSCSLATRNREIVSLEGGCVVRLDLILPKNLKLEVYNLGKLISKYFFPMEYEHFLEQLKQAGSDEKIIPIRNFTASYERVGEHLKLLESQLDEILDNITWDEEKLNALRLLHPHLSSRNELKKILDSQFTYFNRKKAYQIVGLVWEG